MNHQFVDMYNRIKVIKNTIYKITQIREQLLVPKIIMEPQLSKFRIENVLSELFI